MTTRNLLFLFIATLFASCSSSSNLTENPDGKRLVFGTGGGFTGMYSIYELNEDGNLFAIFPDSISKPVKKLRRKQSRNIFAQADKLKLAQPAFNHPGNMTSFIKYKTDGVLSEYIWGDPNVSVPTEIKDLYSQLNSIVK